MLSEKEFQNILDVQIPPFPAVVTLGFAIAVRNAQRIELIPEATVVGDQAILCTTPNKQLGEGNAGGVILVHQSIHIVLCTCQVVTAF